MRRLATYVFMAASTAFGIIGILLVLTAVGNDTGDSDASLPLVKALMISVFVILSSFAVSVAGRYLTMERKS